MTPIELPDIAKALDAAASRHQTPCGTGHMVWRRWGEGPPVVLLHGGSGSWTHWLRTIPAMAGCREVWAADLPGLGDSAMPPTPHTPESCGRAVAAGLRMLVPRERQARLVGFSFGGHVGTYAAIDLADWIADFTIVGSSALGLPFVRLEEFPKERSTMSEEQRLAVHRRTLEILMIAEPCRIDDVAVRLQAVNIAKARFRSREFAIGDDIRRQLARVEVPVRAIWGARDVLANPSPQAAFEAIRTTHPELVARTIADAGHWAMYEQPDAFNAALCEVLGT